MTLIAPADERGYPAPQYCEYMRRESRAERTYKVCKMIPGLLRMPEWTNDTIPLVPREEPRDSVYMKCMRLRREAFSAGTAVLDVVVGESAITQAASRIGKYAVGQIAHMQHLIETNERYRVTVIPDEQLDEYLNPEVAIDVVFESPNDEMSGAYSELAYEDARKSHELWYPADSGEYRLLLASQQALRKSLAPYSPTPALQLLHTTAQTLR